MKLEPSGKKGTFVRYNESSKAYIIYIPGSRQIEVSKDVTFEEEMVVWKGIGSNMEIDDEEMEMRSSLPPAQNELAKKDKPIDPIDPVTTVDIPEDMAVSRKRPRWAQQTLQDVEGSEALHGTSREIKRPHRFSSYVALMSHIIDS